MLPSNSFHSPTAAQRSTVSAAVRSACFALAVAACGGSDAAPGGGAAQNSVDAGTQLDAAAAPLLAPPAKGQGVQFTMNVELPPQSESERCQFVRAPEDLILNHDEIRFGMGSHHVLLFTTQYDDIPTEDLRGNPVDTTQVFDCSDGVQGYWSLSGLIAASQSPEGQSAVSFPAGVGYKIAKGAVLLINAHYINVTNDTLTPKVYINLHTIAESQLKQEGGLLFWYNPFLKVPAGGQSTMSASCPVPQDIHITNIQSHMHRRGVGYQATLIAPDGERSEVYQNDTWEDVPVQKYDPELAVAGGSRIEWQCDYDNAETHDVYQGPRTTDEMCMLIGSYYPRHDETGFCAERGSAFLGANWTIGQGSASCADSMSCVIKASAEHGSASGAATGSDSQALTSSITNCLLASSPALAEPVSNVIGCLASARDGEDPLEKCADVVQACSSQ